MENIFPNYYKNFHCVSDKCEQTCCAGWQIVIDDVNLQRYSNNDIDFTSKIDFQNEVFYQDDTKRCAFLNKNNLCDMYIQKGEEYLCKTCTNYPRAIQEYEEFNDVCVSMSCPEIAKILLNLKDKITFYKQTDELEVEQDEHFDFMLFDILYSSREVLFEILQDRTLDIDARILICLEYVEKIDNCIEENRVFDIDEITQSYKSYNDISPTNNIQKADFINNLYELEVLDNSWTDFVRSSQKTLDIENYQEKYSEFKESVDISTIKEHLMVYYLYMYYLQAVYDEYLLSKFYLPLSSTYVIEQLWFALWLSGDFNYENQYKVLYKYARELEHSDENISILENIINEGI